MGVALQASGWISDATRQVSEVKSEIEKHRDFITALEGGSARTALTIATGAITPPARDFGAHVTVDTEGAAATDTLSTIATTNCAEGSIVFLWLANTARIVTIQHAAGGAGQITLLDGADFEFPAADDVFVKLQLRSTTWVEIERGFGNSQTAAREFRGPSTPYGFYTTRNAVDTFNDVDISAGACWDTTRAAWIEGTAMTKRLDATWSAGTANGMLDTGTVTTETGYYIYVIINDVNGSVDYLASLESTWAAVTGKPANYTKGQIIGFVWRGLSEISEQVWANNYCQYIEWPLVLSDSTITSNTWENYVIDEAPAKSKADFAGYVTDSAASSTSVRVYAKYADGVLGSSSSIFRIAYTELNNATATRPFRLGYVFTLLTNDDSEIAMAAQEAGGSTATINTYIQGYELVNRLEALQ